MKDLKIYYERQKLFTGFDGKFCKVNPSIIKDENRAIILYTMLDLGGSDVFHDTYIAKSTDGGNTFSEPKPLSLYQNIKDGIREIFVPTCTFFHKKSKKFVCLGVIQFYKDDAHPVIVNGHSKAVPTYRIIDFDKCDFDNEPTVLEVRGETLCLPFGQPIEYDNGDVMLSFYGSVQGDDKTSAYAGRFSFDGEKFTKNKMGKPIDGTNFVRGFAEPSLATLNGKYYFTLRTDEAGLFAVSEDGFNFSEPMVWKWDDGSVLENYNTQQRWLRFKDGLYLAYTRKGANNDHVFRHRAPMFMARFDEDNLCLIKSTEVILVPELGARLGNFNITDVSDTESWLVTAEWMQTWPPEWYNYKIPMRYGSNNTIWRAVVKIEK